MNKQLKFSPRGLLLAALLTLLSFAALAHAYHASIMEVRYNTQKQQLEISLKVFTDDFEKALSVGQPRSISFETTPRAQVTQLTTELLRKSLAFSTRPGETLPLQLIGFEKDHEAHWLYLAVKLPKPTNTLLLRHKLLTETFADQMNIVNLDAGGKKQSALFREGNEEQKLSF
ncbi:DUF6702 family protein [Hymenobacter chitinivorans]|uniref:Uncharacterized protein n=1 Tax=Hymenobacter chitinivorans DSM 11115 TaxID=1121954 RepID=A0A2M9AQJ6_9BACT|nr:DUF6702 family protein [Hymenobacter chitinivorans]PJJ47913.1 hypothetical protein CLV45_4603 [Hymenobacter chitinivorans DSM 11115]